METRMMYVRQVGTGVCYTLPDGRFYMASMDEVTEDEKKVVAAGGGYLPVSIPVDVVAR